MPESRAPRRPVTGASARKRQHAGLHAGPGRTRQRHHGPGNAWQNALGGIGNSLSNGYALSQLGGMGGTGGGFNIGGPLGTGI